MRRRRPADAEVTGLDRFLAALAERGGAVERAQYRWHLEHLAAPMPPESSNEPPDEPTGSVSSPVEKTVGREWA